MMLFMYSMILKLNFIIYIKIIYIFRKCIGQCTMPSKSYIIFNRRVLKAFIMHFPSILSYLYLTYKVKKGTSSSKSLKSNSFYNIF